jgi:two-component sensor histidine kinase/CheY-like chemotaxis protein
LTPPQDTGTPTLLYIDDDEGICRLVQRGLERRGYRVTCAFSGADGLARAASQPFDLIAIDHYMPGQDGLETMGQLLALPNPPPVVYVTGSDESRIAVAALKAGAADYVVKTASDDFLDLIAAALAQALDQVKLIRERDAANAALRDTNSQLEAIVARQAVLIREVNHRVANSLQLVSSLVHMQANAAGDEASKAALRDTQARIGAIMQVHRRLYTSDDVEQVDLAEYLSGLVSELSQSLGAGAGRPIRLSADPLVVSTDKAVAIGVIVAELVTNACKYAYRDGDFGEVRIGLVADGESRALLSVEDDGVGIPADGLTVKGTGLGQKVIAAMGRSLNSAVIFDAAHAKGARAVMTLAL